MSPGSGESGEQVFEDTIFSVGCIREGDSVRTTFVGNLKIAGKTDLFDF